MSDLCLAWGLELRQEVRAGLYQFLLNQHSFTFQGPRNLLVTLVTPDGNVQEQNKVESESDNQDPGSVSSPPLVLVVINTQNEWALCLLVFFWVKVKGSFQPTFCGRGRKCFSLILLSFPRLLFLFFFKLKWFSLLLRVQKVVQRLFIKYKCAWYSADQGYREK